VSTPERASSHSTIFLSLPTPPPCFLLLSFIAKRTVPLDAPVRTILRTGGRIVRVRPQHPRTGSAAKKRPPIFLPTPSSCRQTPFRAFLPPSVTRRRCWFQRALTREWLFPFPHSACQAPRYGSGKKNLSALYIFSNLQISTLDRSRGMGHIGRLCDRIVRRASLIRDTSPRS